MATFKEINHDSGPPVSNHYTLSIVDASSRATITVASALGGSVEGLQIASPGGGSAVVLDEGMSAPVGEFRLRVRFDPNGVTRDFDRDYAVSVAAAGGAVGSINFIVKGGGGFAVEGAYRDAGGFSFTPEFSVTDAEHCVECEVVEETGSANNGIFRLYIDGVLQFTDIGVDNELQFSFIDRITVNTGSVNSNLVGTFYIDEILVDDLASTSLCASALTIAPMTKPADIDADGSNLYIALLEGANPILVKMSTALDTNGTTVFTPGAGDDIGVQCGRFDADVIWVAGAFDGTNTVEKSEDGGTTFTVKDPATFGDVEAFVVGPDSDIRVLIADDNVNVQETIDDGTVWTAINSGTGFNVNAIARLPQNVQESVFGNDAGAVDNVDYSPNSGADMEDFSTGFPTQDATRVIVN